MVIFIKMYLFYIGSLELFAGECCFLFCFDLSQTVTKAKQCYEEGSVSWSRYRKN